MIGFGQDVDPHARKETAHHLRVIGPHVGGPGSRHKESLPLESSGDGCPVRGDRVPLEGIDIELPLEPFAGTRRVGEKELARPRVGNQRQEERFEVGTAAAPRDAGRAGLRQPQEPAR